MLSSTRKTILLVDDDVDHLCLCSRILQRQNFSVHTLPGCNSLDDLLEEVRDFRPAVIFMDHQMPGIGGLDATRMLKSNQLSRSIPIVYFTSRDDILQLAAAAGADEVLRKSSYVQQLLKLAYKYTG